MKIWSRWLGRIALAGAAIVGTACGGEPPAAAVAFPALADVIFEGEATAPALESLLAATPRMDPLRAPVIDSPADLSLFKASMVPTFAWHGVQAGDACLLLFTTEKDPRLLRVFTTKTSYTPGAAAWQKLAGAATWTKLTPFSASFVEDRMLPSSGPMEGTPIQFCVEE